MVFIRRFSAELPVVWNDFIKQAKNGIFLFDRGYMDYHADRFEDHSLLFYNDDELLAVLPASLKNDVLTSHGGLTYGGFIMHKRANISFMVAAFEELKNYMKANHIHSLIYKAIPYIYHNVASQEDLYVLFRNNAKLYRRDLSSVIYLSNRIVYTKGTKSNLSKARKNNLRIEQSNDFEKFMKIEEEILLSKYGVKPTHTAGELTLLANRFPTNIKLFFAYYNDTRVGGTIVYETSQVVHTQYIGITDQGKEMGALDAITDYLIQLYQDTHKYFSFGISTVNEGNVLNEGLVRNKESFGARAIVHDFYKIDLNDSISES
jgi:hypothetical protein